MPERDRPGPVASKWPVVARFPQIAADPVRRESRSSATTGEAIDYRFDPPQGHSLHHVTRSDDMLRPARRDSPILPRSDPFAISGSSWLEAFGPVARFLTLVALFTAAGMILLAKRNGVPASVGEKVSAEALQARPSLEPAAVAMESPAVAPTATGPALGPNSVGDAQHAHIADPPKQLIEQSDVELPGDIDATLDSAENSTSPYPQTAWPAPTFPQTPSTETQTTGTETTKTETTRIESGILPQVQTTDPPQAVAHLPGIITEIPSRHASHDDNQPGLH
jgi:hypothetical protein